MADTSAIFRELMAGLSEEERQAIPPRPHWGWYHPLGPADPWRQFIETFGLWWGLQQELCVRLIPRFAAWLEGKGDARGEFIRLHLELVDAGWKLVGPESELELSFLHDIVSHPTGEETGLIFADWLEERGDARASSVRLLGRCRALSRSLDPWWVEGFHFFISPRPPNYSKAFTNKCCRLFPRAKQEAQRLNHCFLSTQHVLLALLGESFGFASTSLAALGLTESRVVNAAVERRARRISYGTTTRKR